MENKTKEKNTILVTVEDKNEKMKNLKEEVKEIEEIKLVKDNEDGTKQYAVTSADKVDLRKKYLKFYQNRISQFLNLKRWIYIRRCIYKINWFWQKRKYKQRRIKRENKGKEN